MDDGTTECPRCGSKTTATPAKEGRERWKVAADGMSYVVEEYVCARCGLYYMDTSLGSKEKDPDRFKWQLAKDKKKIREVLKGLGERMEFIDFGVWPVGAKGKTVSMKFELVMVFDYPDYHGGCMIHQELFNAIEEMDYKIFYVFVDWQNKKVKIMIEKEVKV